MRWPIRHNSTLYVAGSAAMGAVLGSRRAQRDIEKEWRLTPFTPMLDPGYQSRYRQFRAVEYAAILGATMVLLSYAARRSPSLTRALHL